MNVRISVKALPGSRPEQAARMLKVGGVTPFTATDFPGMLSAVVFVQGCPWRCGYCHNPHLQPRLADSPLAPARIRDLLARRVGLVDAIVFSGGEPTMDPALPDAIREVRAMGFKAGLHSGGIYPARLRTVLPLIDWIGLDIKAPFDERYDRVTQVRESAVGVRESLKAVLDSGVDYECRTTIHPDLHSEADIAELAHTLAETGVKNYALQVFRTQGCDSEALNSATLSGYPNQAVVSEVASLFESFTLRRG